MTSVENDCGATNCAAFAREDEQAKALVHCVQYKRCENRKDHGDRRVNIAVLHRVDNGRTLPKPHRHRDQRMYEIKRVGCITKRDQGGQHTRLAKIDPAERDRGDDYERRDTP